MLHDTEIDFEYQVHSIRYLVRPVPDVDFKATVAKFRCLEMSVERGELFASQD